MEYTDEELTDMLDSGIAATDCPEGCEVEPDGTCAHGYQSIFLEMGVI